MMNLILMCVIPVVFCTTVGVRYVNTYSRTQLYLTFKFTGAYNNEVFRPYMWAIIRLRLDLQLRLYYTHASTVIPRLRKIIRSVITFVNRNVISRRFL